MRVALHGGSPVSGARGRVVAVGVSVAMALAAVVGLPAAAVASPAAGSGGVARQHTGITPSAQTLGIDVNAGQEIDWPAAWQSGARFAYIEATEGASYTNPNFGSQTLGATEIGMEHGAFHFADPSASSGQAQADFFVAHGGGWSRDGRTLPPLLDIEANPFGGTCYGKSQAGMVTWLKSFTAEVHTKTTRWPVIYTSTSWWATCTGNDASFGVNDPLFLAGTSTEPGLLPAGWSVATFWQSIGSGAFPTVQDWFNGTLDQLKAFANG